MKKLINEIFIIYLIVFIGTTSKSKISTKKSREVPKKIPKIPAASGKILEESLKSRKLQKIPAKFRKALENAKKSRNISEKATNSPEKILKTLEVLKKS